MTILLTADTSWKNLNTNRTYGAVKTLAVLCKAWGEKASSNNNY